MSQYVLINEEYGYRYWIGQCNKQQAEELKRWWVKLPSVMGMFFNPQGEFPLEIEELNDETEDKYELNVKNVSVYVELHEDSDSSLKIMGDRIYYHAGYRTNN